MATIANRAQFEVIPRAAANASKAKKFRSRSQAEAYKTDLASEGVPASIKQAETGSWQAIVRLIDGQGNKIEKASTFHTKEQAEEWASSIEGSIRSARNKNLSMTVSDTPWKQAVMTWFAIKVVGCSNEADWMDEEKLKEAEGVMAGKKVIGYNIKRVIADFGAETPIGEITKPVVRKWRDQMMHVEKYTPSTIANYRQIISGTFRYYISEKDLQETNPCKELEWPKPDNAITPPDLSNEKISRGKAPASDVNDGDEDDLDPGPSEILKSDEELLIAEIQAKSPWLVPIVKFALETAARRSEILRLEWEHIDFDKGLLRIIKEKNDFRKNNNTPKGRVLPIWKRLAELLIETQPNPKKRKGLVFEGTASSCSHSFANAVKALGWTDMSFHSLRKIATGRLAKKLPNCIELSSITGHKDLQTLATRYYGTDLAKLAEKITNS